MIFTKLQLHCTTGSVVLSEFRSAFIPYIFLGDRVFVLVGYEAVVPVTRSFLNNNPSRLVCPLPVDSYTEKLKGTTN